jgi:hypothetical protein
LFQGNGTNVIRIIPYCAVQFAAYEEYKKVSQKNIAKNGCIFLSEKTNLIISQFGV